MGADRIHQRLSDVHFAPVSADLSVSTHLHAVRNRGDRPLRGRAWRLACPPSHHSLSSLPSRRLRSGAPARTRQQWSRLISAPALLCLFALFVLIILVFWIIRHIRTNQRDVVFIGRNRCNGFSLQQIVDCLNLWPKNHAILVM